jgi:hypothetical protein
MKLTSSVLLAARRPRVALSAFAACCTVCGLAVAVPADAAASGPVPVVDCVATSATTGETIAYFGYANAGAVVTVGVGAGNQLFPVAADEGQPTEFLSGTYPRVFAVTFSELVTPTVSWILNGQQADASAASPQCAPGTTTPASDVTGTTATLNGVVNPDGNDVHYTFEYGTTPAYGATTADSPGVDAGAGDVPVPVGATLAGLAPGTAYYYRLDTTTTYPGGAGTVTVDGAQQQFATAAAPAPAPTVTVTAPGPTVTATVTATPAPAPTVTVTQTPAPAPTVTVTVTPAATGLALNTTALPSGTAGVPYSAALSASGGTPPYTWRAARMCLPPGLRLDPLTGVLSGRPELPGTYHVTITVTDSAAPARESLSEQYTIEIAR